MSSLGDAGQALYDELASAFDFEPHELAVVLEAARVKDRLDALDAVVRAEGVTTITARGVTAHPALVEARQQELVLARLIASLRLPDEDGNQAQRRGAARGTYGGRATGGARLAKPGPRGPGGMIRAAGGNG